MKKVSVQCRNIRLSYGSTEVLRDVNLDIAPGEFFALLGPSGSGKSSLLRLIAGFNRHTNGQLLVDGQDITDLETWRRPVGLVFQNYALWPHLSVWDNVAFGLVERRVDKAQMATRVGAALEMVGLSAYGQRRPSQLSGGQQQRVALARTLVVEPQVLLLDEPLSNLDKTLRVQMRQELLSLQRRLGLTTVFVTHDQEEAMTTADRMAVLDQGVVQQVGTPMQLYDEPVNAFVAHFVGTMNALPVVVKSAPGLEAGGDGAWVLEVGGAVSAIVQVPSAAAAHRLKPGEAAWLCSRPHHAVLREPGTSGGEQLLWLTATVQDREFLGEFVRYRLADASAQALGLHVDAPHRAAQVPRGVGQSVLVGLDLSQARLLPR
ncbi:MAG: ABC transporter ATP-binding protein [Betaproteobacteria bacterium]|nr:ABC transporter ATP-binding protein [Betaproteobacteria bacterium]